MFIRVDCSIVRNRLSYLFALQYVIKTVLTNFVYIRRIYEILILMRWKEATNPPYKPMLTYNLINWAGCQLRETYDLRLSRNL